MEDFQKITEYPSPYRHLETKPVGEILSEINAEDHKVADAVEKAIPQITRLVEQLVPRMRRGGFSIWGPGRVVVSGCLMRRRYPRRMACRPAGSSV